MFTLPTTPMTLSEAVKNTFKLWWNTLVSTLPLSILAALLNILPQFTILQMHLNQTHPAVFFMVMAITGLISFIPITAIFAKIGHTAHQQPITLSQALAISLVKYPSIVGWVLLFSACLLAAAGVLALFSSIKVLFLLFFLILMTVVIYVLCTVPLIIFENLGGDSSG